MSTASDDDRTDSTPAADATTTASTADEDLLATHSFDDREGRRDEMRASLEDWIDQLADLVEQARGEEAFKRLLEVQAKFHDYSLNNQILIFRQMPDATRVAGYNTWKEMGRYVQQGESAIWIWAPLTSEKCPKCGNAPSYHDREDVDCEYHEQSDPDTWQEGVVGFKPVPVYDISQTDGEPLPSVDNEATGDASDLLPALKQAAEDLPLQLEVVDESDWDYGRKRGVCDGYSPHSAHPVIEVKDRANDADKSRTIVHEIAHALLHYVRRRDSPEREKREVEAEAAAYVVCQYYGLDASNSRFYLASWSDEAAEDLRERFDRICETAQRIISEVDSHLPDDHERAPNTGSDRAEPTSDGDAGANASAA